MEPQVGCTNHLHTHKMIQYYIQKVIRPRLGEKKEVISLCVTAPLSAVNSYSFLMMLHHMITLETNQGFQALRHS